MIMTVGEETAGDDDYDVWFQEQVRRGLREADDPKTEWVSHDQVKADIARETLINGPTSEVAGEMASNFLDDEANRRSIQ
ncbi:hypothetical protein [Burkholderia multivorans]|uniref:hypothetical protein n=1 Tax=Burkholderia multivorans TaxID=87883 RepID=UPI0011856E7C|nr:hypothetical protein [Burkholderia multivorans]